MSLTVTNLSKNYGGLLAVNDVSFTAEPGEITSVIGPNGAGKTTLLNLISGVVKPSAGKVHLFAEEITCCVPHTLAQHGLARTYQNPLLFERMTVLETVMVGAHLKGQSGFLGSFFNRFSVAREEIFLENEARRALERVELPSSIFHRDALELSYGLQRRVDIARAIAMGPKVLLLDEPAAGLNSRETDQISELATGLCSDGYVIVLVEHDMDMVMNISKKVVVMNFGQKLTEGTPDSVQENPEVIRAYLGVDEGAAHA